MNNQNEFDETYKKVLSLVERGSTISAAAKKMNIERTSLYSRMTDLQKQEIFAAKVLNAKSANMRHYVPGMHRFPDSRIAFNF